MAGRGLRLGALVLQSTAWSELAVKFREVEDAGYDVAYVADHLTHPTLPGEWLAEPWPVLAAAASVTSRLDLGTLVASSAFRSPVSLARLAATTNDVSGGRVVLGLGAGTRFCATADRGAEPGTAEMTRRFADMVRGLVAVWEGEPAWEGEELRFAGVDTLPQPPDQVPPFLLLAAHGPRAADLVGRHADGWSTYGGPAGAALDGPGFWELLGTQSAMVTAACERAGRDPGALRRSVLLGYGTVRPLESGEAYLRCAEAAVAAGFDELVVYWPHGAPDSRFWSDPDVHTDGVRRVREAFGPAR
jgi:alkanesulfonate monooxygenase SsuD/methylene tetrahydromethanopterin reductase-like flavin-dependent oxidoreductase (luciferase family)